MKTKKRNIIEWAMHYRQIVLLVTCCLVIFGIYGLQNMNKNEFPDFTIRQGLVIAAYPGATVAELEEQVAKPLEDYIFSYKEVKKSKTQTICKDGLVVIQVQLNDDLNNKDEFWSKFKHGVAEFKSSLPKGVLALMVQDDFGDTSALLIAMESNDKTYRELNDYMNTLKDQLRKIESVGRMNVLGMQQEQISIYLDNNKLSNYGISNNTLALTFFSKGFTTSSGRVKTPDYNAPIYMKNSLNTIRDVQEMVVFSDFKGNNVKLKDIATVVREYDEPTSYITNNGNKCLILSVEMKKGRNIVKMGDEINELLSKYEKTLPNDVKIFKITDQSEVVAHSVDVFLMELLIAVIAVILVVMLLMPFNVAMVAASTIPITIFISLGLFYIFGIELNTVTLAALICTLGMIVDNSIVIVDSYLEKIGEGMSRWHASIYSTKHFFKSIFSATLAISITFFPFLFTLTGMTNDFLQNFPWATLLVLSISLLFAVLVVPFMQFYFIRKPHKSQQKTKKSFSFLDILQNVYDKLIDICFKFPKTTLLIGILSIVVGCYMMSLLPQKLMPSADRNQFAVEIYTPEGTSLKKTVAIADSLENIMKQDERIVSITSFKGMSSPRFHTAYAPQMGGENYAQFIVNTESVEATVDILNEYTPKYTTYFPEAIARFKQLSYSESAMPIEVRISGDDLTLLKKDAEKIQSLLRSMPEILLVKNNIGEPLPSVSVELNEDESIKFGITNAILETSLLMRYGSGIPITTVWEDDYDVNVVLKSNKSDLAEFEDLNDELIAIGGGLANVPLRQVAQIKPTWNEGSIYRRNGIKTITISADVKRDYNAMSITQKVQDAISDITLSDGVTLSYGGEYEENNEQMPNMIAALLIAIIIILFILVFHFKKVGTAILIVACLALCVFGAGAGVLIQGVDFSVTSVMGIVSLMGILVRNGIIMFDYAEELRKDEKMIARVAIYNSAKRRMRPIFLTSMAASMGVIPMILGKSGLWMPMGTVIFYGTLITMIFVLTVMPVAYSVVMSGTTKKRAHWNKMEKE